MYNSWKNNLPAYFNGTEEEPSNIFMSNVDELVEIVVQPMIDFIRVECVETSATND